jgi:predicted metal-dependent hydrolase
MSNLKYFEGYSESVKVQVDNLVSSGNLKSYLLKKYPAQHKVTTDKLLFQYANSLRLKYMKKTSPLNKVVFEKQKNLVRDALGTHTFVSRNHGGKLKSKHEIRIATSLKFAPVEMLELLVVHELAHFKEKEHNKAFYKLCVHMQEDYFQVEFDLRLFLLLIDLGDSLY